MRKGILEQRRGGRHAGGFTYGFAWQDRIDFQQAEQSLQDAYRGVYVQYRKDDELEVATPHHRRLAIILEQISSSFDRPISVLDVGCGTGRYFHCLKNVKRLIGADLSPEMLQAARSPVRQEEVSAEKIELLRANAHFLSFPARRFEFIYSLGMFGHGCPITLELCDKFYEWLPEDGVLFFSTLALSTLPLTARMRKRLRLGAEALLPESWREKIQRRKPGLPFCGMTRQALTEILRSSRFERFTVSEQGWRSPLWRSVHLECEALKSR